DYGVRFAHMRPQFDAYGYSSNFLPEQWAAAQAPRLYVSGCVNNVYPCVAANRRALDPVTGQMLGANSTLAIGTLVPNTGSMPNLSSTGLATEAAPSLTVWQLDNKLSASTQWNAGVQMTLPFAAALDVAYTGQHSYDTNTAVNINGIDLGTAFLPATQNPALA